MKVIETSFKNPLQPGLEKCLKNVPAYTLQNVKTVIFFIVDPSKSEIVYILT